MRAFLLISLLAIQLAASLHATVVRPGRQGVPASSSPSPSSDTLVDRFRRQADDDNDDSQEQQLPEPFNDPETPKVPPALAQTNPECLFYQYIQAKPLTVPAVQQQIQQLCVQNSTVNIQQNGGWCEIDLEVVISEIGSTGAGAGPLRMDPDMFQSVRDLHIYVHFTRSGLWQVMAIPDCGSEENKARVVRALFMH